MLESGDDSLLFDATPDLMVQYSTRHLSKVMDVKDPEGRGRVRVLVPGLLSTGKENWSDWIEVTSVPVGGVGKSEGDQGMWWPMGPGQSLMMEFVSGDPFAYGGCPGPACQKGEGSNKQLIPKEAKKAGEDDPRGTTRIRILKAEAGHSLLFDDRGGKEKAALIDWTGSGLYLVGPGKAEDEKEEEGEESKQRKGERRGTKLVGTGTSKSVKDLIEGAKYLLGLLDLNGQGIISTATDGEGKVAIYAAGKNGDIGPSILIDTSAPRIYITCGEVQAVWRGDKGDIQTTRSIIQELEKKYPVENMISSMRSDLSKAFEEFNE